MIRLYHHFYGVIRKKPPIPMTKPSKKESIMAISICNTTTDESGRELVTHGTTQFPLACYHDDLLLEPVPWHWHEELEAVVISEGEAVIIIENEKYTLTKGNGYFTNTNALHAAYLETQETCKFHSLVFHPRLVAGNLDSIYWQKYMEPILQNYALKGLFLDQTIDWHKAILISIEQASQACLSETLGFELLVRNE